MGNIHADTALIGGACKQNVVIDIDREGVIASVQCHKTPMIQNQMACHLLPGMANVHSHAFQRLMAGLAEYRVTGHNSFWSWRETMYHLANTLSADQLYATARMVYLEMVKAGYTAVGEFHYLHGSDQGRAKEMAVAVMEAAASVGLPITMLPVLYQTSDFGGAAPIADQQSFTHSLDDYLSLLSFISGKLGPDDRLGMALHSLRAVPADQIKAAVQAFNSGPIHIHIAEQQAEVQSCLDHTGQRPVAWLLNTVYVDERWTMVHATHMDSGEVEQLAKSGAVAGLCPTTEANLGDGFFRAKEYLDDSGRIAIGSDSHITVDAREELRLLEYGERLQRQKRSVLSNIESSSHHTGENLYTQCAAGGAQSLQQPMGAISPGRRADLVMLDANAPSLAAAAGGQLTDAYIFNGQPSPIKHVMIAGQWVIREGVHVKQQEIVAEYVKTAAQLKEALNA